MQTLKSLLIVGIKRMSEKTDDVWQNTTKQLDDSVRVLNHQLSREFIPEYCRVGRSPEALRKALEDVKRLLRKYLSLEHEESITERMKAIRRIGITIRQEHVEDCIAEAEKVLIKGII